MVTKEQLERLKEPMPYKWRVQSTKFGKSTVVAYVDARQVQDKLDEVLGADSWQNDFKLIDGKLFGGIGIHVGDAASVPQWNWKWDTGVESNMDAEKGQVSDAFKRAAVQWGVGRFLYSLGIVTLHAKEHSNKKEYPVTRDGKILWNSEELNAYVNKIVGEGVFDDTRPNKPVQATKESNPTKATPAKKEAATEPKTPVKTKVADPKADLVDKGGNLKPNTAAIDNPNDAERKAKAKQYFAKLTDEATILKFLIKEKGLRSYTKVDAWIDGTPTDEVLAVYTELKARLQK